MIRTAYSMSRRQLMLSLVMISVIAFTSKSQAILIAYDGFNYTTGTLDGNGSAADPGFSTEWTQSGSNGGNVTASGLSYANLEVSGGALSMAAGGTTLNFRGLDSVYSDSSHTTTGEFWFSYLMQPGAFTGAPFVGISFYTDAISGVAASNPDFGIVARNQGGTVYGFTDLDIANQVESAVVPTEGETVLLVGQVIFGGGEGSGVNDVDKINVYVNPVLGGSVPLPEVSTDFTADFQSFRLAAQNGVPFTLDELRFGETFLDVTPTLLADPDLDGNGVGISDFNLIRNSFLTEANHANGDVDFSGFVDHSDYFIWRQAFLTAGGSLTDLQAVSVPEPGSVVMLGGFVLLASLVRKTQR